MQLDVEQLKEKLKKLFEEKIVINKTQAKTYTVSDLYKEAAKLVQDEFKGMKERALTPAEQVKSEELAKLISKMALKEMKLL